jgi:hypothetical protein
LALVGGGITDFQASSGGVEGDPGLGGARTLDPVDLVVGLLEEEQPFQGPADEVVEQGPVDRPVADDEHLPLLQTEPEPGDELLGAPCQIEVVLAEGEASAQLVALHLLERGLQQAQGFLGVGAPRLLRAAAQLGPGPLGHELADADPLADAVADLVELGLYLRGQPMLEGQQLRGPPRAEPLAGVDGVQGLLAQQVPEADPVDVAHRVEVRVPLQTSRAVVFGLAVPGEVEGLGQPLGGAPAEEGQEQEERERSPAEHGAASVGRSREGIPEAIPLGEGRGAAAAASE